MPKYFIGNVLSPTDENQPEADDETFAFTKEESVNLSLAGKPVLLEHDKHMEVGNILRDWTSDDGSKWVLGKLKDEGLYAKFAKYSVDKTPFGDGYYKGLSLQHVCTQYASGKNTKEGVEVSLVVEPRRNDCHIAFLDRNEEPNEHETKKILYKMSDKSNKTFNMSEQVEKVTETTPAKQEETAPKPVENRNAESDSFNMSREDMMKVIIQQQKDLEQSSSDSAELKKLKEQMEAAKAEELKRDQEKAYNLSRALVDQWAESLDTSVMSDEAKESVLKMAKDYPRESMELLRIAHCASKKHKQLNEDFLSLQKNSADSKLQSEFKNAIQKKRPAEETVGEVVQKASKKSKTSHVAEFLEAMSKYNVSGSARENMRECAEYSKKQRKTYF